MKAKTRLTEDILNLRPLTDKERRAVGFQFHKTSMYGTDKHGRVFYPTRNDIYYVVK